MASHWYIDTDAPDDDIVAAFRDVFFTKPDLSTRLQFWSKAAQLQSNLRWESTHADGAAIAAVMVSGGMRELTNTPERGPGSELGAILALAIDAEPDVRHVQLWSPDGTKSFDFNQQADLVKSDSRQIAAKLAEYGHGASAHK